MAFSRTMQHAGMSGHCSRRPLQARCRATPSRRSAVATHASALISTTQQSIPVDCVNVSRMRLRTTKACELAVSVYPTFAYDAEGGGGWATLQDQGNGMLYATFDPSTVTIPSLSWRTAKLFGLPIPPPLDIDIQPRKLQGTIDTVTGEVLLEFDAEFLFTAGSLYKAPPLVVRTILTTGYTKGRFREGTGTPFTGSGGRLVGTAQVERTGDAFMDTFLMLPTDALAVMAATLEFE